MPIIEVTKSIVMLENEYGANIICFALDEELFFVDTGHNTEIAIDFRKKMEKRFDRRTTTLLITHGHIDHLFGMGAFEGLRVIAAETAKQRFERFIHAQYTDEVIANLSRIFPHFEKSVESAKLFLPNAWVEKEMVLGNNQEITFQVVGGHSSCSSVIHFLPEEVLVVGDLVQMDLYPYFGEVDTNIHAWIAALKSWEEKNFRTFLPGHGKPFDKLYLASVRIFFEQLVHTLKQLKEHSLPIEEVIHHPQLTKGYWPDTAIRKPPYDYSLANLYKTL